MVTFEHKRQQLSQVIQMPIRLYRKSTDLRSRVHAVNLQLSSHRC